MILRRLVLTTLLCASVANIAAQDAVHLQRHSLERVAAHEYEYALVAKRMRLLTYGLYGTGAIVGGVLIYRYFRKAPAVNSPKSTTASSTQASRQPNFETEYWNYFLESRRFSFQLKEMLKLSVAMAIAAPISSRLRNMMSNLFEYGAPVTKKIFGGRVDTIDLLSHEVAANIGALEMFIENYGTEGLVATDSYLYRDQIVKAHACLIASTERFVAKIALWAKQADPQVYAWLYLKDNGLYTQLTKTTDALEATLNGNPESLGLEQLKNVLARLLDTCRANEQC